MDWTMGLVWDWDWARNVWVEYGSGHSVGIETECGVFIGIGTDGVVITMK